MATEICWKCKTSGGGHWLSSKCGGRSELKGSIRLIRWSRMFQRPLKQTQSLSQVENIIVYLFKSSVALDADLNLKWWSTGCWLRTSLWKWHPRPMPCHLWSEKTSLHLVLCRRPDRERPVREWSQGQRCQEIIIIIKVILKCYFSG